MVCRRPEQNTSSNLVGAFSHVGMRVCGTADRNNSSRRVPLDDVRRVNEVVEHELRAPADDTVAVGLLDVQRQGLFAVAETNLGAGLRDHVPLLARATLSTTDSLCRFAECRYTSVVFTEACPSSWLTPYRSSVASRWSVA